MAVSEQAVSELRPRPRHVSPADWEHWEQRILEGVDPLTASRERGLATSDYRKSDHERHRDLLALSREAVADKADERLDRWANVDGASDQMRTYWHRYHANRAGRVQERVEVVNADPLRLGEMTLEEKLAVRARILADHPEVAAAVADARGLPAGTPTLPVGE